MLKLLKFIGIGLAVLLLALFLIPFAFQGKIKDIALHEANKMLNSEVYINDAALSFFRNFPHVSVSLYDFGIAGKGEFQGDSLLKAEKMMVVISTRSLFTDRYVIDGVHLRNAEVKAIVNENGNVNWDILKADSTETVEEDTTASTPFSLALDKVTFKKVNVKYIDRQQGMNAGVDNITLDFEGDISSSDVMLANIKNLNLAVDSVAYSDSSMTAGLNNFNFDFSGKVSDAIAKIKSKLDVESVNMTMQHVPYLSGVNVKADVNVDADLANNKYTFGDNSFAFNEVKANLSGFVQMVDSSTIDMDVKFNTPKLEFKDILSLIPAIYKSDFASIKTDGKVALEAVAKGRMQGDNLPSFDAKLLVENAMLKYPDLPKQINNINISAEVNNPGGSADKTVVEVKNFSFLMANNPFAAHLVLKTPVSDPDFDCAVKGTIDFNSIKDVIALEDMNLNGILTADASAAGKMSYVENNMYDKFSVLGNVNLKDMKINGKAVGYDINIQQANLDFSNKALDLTAFDMNVGKNDVHLKGKVENFLPYILSDGTVKAELSVNSTYLNANDFLGEETAEDSTSAAPSETASSPIDIPANIDFALNLAMKQLIYTNIELNDVKGGMTVRNKVVNLSNLSAKTMEGELGMKATYDSRATDNSAFNASMNVKQMSIPTVFSTVNTAKKYVPLLSNATGKFNMQIDMNSKLDGSMAPVLNTVNAKGLFTTDELGLKEFEALKRIAVATKYSKLTENTTLKNVSIKYAIKDGRMTTEPFKVKMGNCNMDVSGFSGLDETLDYKAVMTVPNSVTEKTNIPLNFIVLIGGTFSNPKVSVDSKSMVNDVKEVVKEKVQETVKNTVNKALEEAKAQQAKLLAEANKTASFLKAEAEKQGEKLIAEAKNQGDKMVAASKNPVEKKVKQKAADKLVEEATKKKAKLMSEAEAKGKSLINEAQAKSDKMIKEAEAKNNK